MSETIWRIDKARYRSAAKTGDGARAFGGRWTSPGFQAIYCAEHLSLAILEVIVHAPHPDARAVARVRFRIRIDPDSVEHVVSQRIPRDLSPRTPFQSTREIGDEWLKQGRTPVLSVPSAIVPAERNYILNPRHPRFSELSWDGPETISLDTRLWAVPA